jgi:AAA+ ATPase superfamily predicted ATPase
MKNKPANPFITGGYISSEYFCNRKDETSLLMKAISSKRNITLISLRRMGKTGLLKHLKYLLEKDKSSVAVIYVDLMPTMNGSEMLNAVSSALLQVKQNERNFFEKVLTTLATLRPKLTYDNLTGQPSIELKVESPADIQFGLGHLMSCISEIKKDLVFIFDEFQQISRYPDNNIEQVLRSIIQTYPDIPFIFSGSSKHMLEPMFSAAGRPFYQSTELMYLNSIPENDYRNFIMEKFATGHKTISQDAISRIFKWTRLHTFYVQYVCNLLFESEQNHINNESTSQVFQRVLTSYEPLFINFRNLLPLQQFRLLQAIASENIVDKPTAGAFIQKYNLVGPSSVMTSLKSLAEKEMIVLSENAWQVYDVFFSRWLEYHYGKK